MQPTKDNILVKLIGTEEFMLDGIIIPMKRKSHSIQVEITAIPNQDYYHDLELSEDDNLNKRKFNFKVGDICILSFSNSSNAFARYDEKGNNIGMFAFVNPNHILATYARKRIN